MAGSSTEQAVIADPSAGATLTEPLIAPGTTSAIKGATTGQEIDKERLTAFVPISFEQLANYMVRLASTIIVNIDEIDKKFLAPGRESGATSGDNSPIDLVYSCAKMAAAGSVMLSRGRDVSMNFEEPKAIEVEITNGKTTVVNVDWDNITWKFFEMYDEKPEDFDEMTFKGAHKVLEQFVSAVFEMSYGYVKSPGKEVPARGYFLPKEISLMLNPLAEPF